MLQFQDSLPKLPLPTLEQTCDRYFQFVSPLLNPEELAHTQAAITDFQQGVGPQLQQQLERISQYTSTSYLHEIGVKNFLEFRSPLPIHINFGGVLTPLEGTAEAALPRLAATWIACLLQFFTQVRDGHLEPDRESPKSGAAPLCMVQYQHLFGNARIPGINCDTLKPRQDRHNIVVVRHNRYYSLELIEADQIASIETIEQQVQWILEQPPSAAPGIGALTTLNRTRWAILRKSLEAESATNVQSLSLLDNALFIVCLDAAAPDNLATTARTALHGDGRNRWFDKPLQFIFTDNGLAGINVEHAGLDGFAIMRCLSEIHKIAQRLSPAMLAPTSDSFAPLSPLDWVLTSEMLTEIQEAGATINRLINKTDLQLLQFNGYGRNDMKQWGFSPDAVVQLAIQLAYMRLYGRPDCTYESVHTRRFRNGRTEAMRSVTPESIELSRLFLTPSTEEERYMAFEAAAAAHTARIRDCQQGNGVDRHLAALNLLAQRQGLAPQIFEDRGYKVLGQSVLSTSSLAPSMGIEAFCFGPVVEHGYGIGYIIKPSEVTLCVSSRYRQTPEFVKHLENSLSDLGKLMAR